MHFFLGVPRFMPQGPNGLNFQPPSAPTVFAQTWWGMAHFEPWANAKKLAKPDFEFLAHSISYTPLKSVLFLGYSELYKKAYFGVFVENRPPLKFNLSGGMFYTFF